MSVSIPKSKSRGLEKTKKEGGFETLECRLRKEIFRLRNKVNNIEKASQRNKNLARFRKQISELHKMHSVVKKVNKDQTGLAIKTLQKINRLLENIED
jgi:Skp family chaperone for outer membrane proteins